MMMRYKRYGVTILTCCVLLGFWVTAAAAQGNAKIVYSDNADALVLQYTQSHDMLAENDPIPLLRVYGDGRVWVHIPAYMKKAGDYEMTLKSQELDELLQSMAAKGIMDFDAANMRALVQQSMAKRKQKGTVVSLSDVSRTEIEVHLQQYTSAKTGQSTMNLDKTIAWDNVLLEAALHPDIEALQDLAAAERELRALLSHSALRPVE